MTSERAHFGARLRREREARSLSISDVVKVTKIPERSLTALENGAFEELPAEVFVRGFLKSYCRSIGLDSEETISSYNELVNAGAPKRRELPSLARPAPSRELSAAAPPPPAAPAPPDRPAEKAAATEPAKDQEERSIFAALAGAGSSTGRASLTVAVIILVIVATLTLSLLLRRPGHAGDGVSAASVSARNAC